MYVSKSVYVKLPEACQEFIMKLTPSELRALAFQQLVAAIRLDTECESLEHIVNCGASAAIEGLKHKLAHNPNLREYAAMFYSIQNKSL